MYAGIITSPENAKKLDRYKEIARRLSRAEGLTDDEARALAAEGKSIVWIDGGLHATEVLGAQQLIELQYQLVSRNDPETLRLLNGFGRLARKVEQKVNPVSESDGIRVHQDFFVSRQIALGICGFLHPFDHRCACRVQTEIQHEAAAFEGIKQLGCHQVCTRFGPEHQRQ